MEDTSLKKDQMQKTVRELDFFKKAEGKWHWIVVFAFSIYVVQGFVNILYMGSWLDEGKYLIKSFWYVTGQVQPYGNEDSTGYMPLFFYELGWWQKVLGIGHYSGRIFSFCIGLLNLGALFIVARKIFKNRLLAALSVVFLATNPMAVKYFCTATPYAMVSLISLLTFYILVRQNEFNWIMSAALAGLGYFLLYFHRSNMIIGIVLFIIFQWTFADKLKINRIIISVGITAILWVWILSIFPDKLSFFAMEFPIVTPLLMQIGILNDPFKLITENSFFPTESGWGLSSWYHSIHAFFSAYVVHYFPVIILSLISLFAALKEKIISKPVGFTCVYFAIMSAGHFLGSQGYCKTCIQPYTIYFLVFGAMASAYATMYVFTTTLSSLTEYRKGFKHGLICVFVIASIGIYFSDLAYLISNPMRSYVSGVNSLAKQIQSIIPENEKVLVIGGSRAYAPQAVFLAERKLETTSINQSHSYRGLKRGLSADVKRKTIQQLDALNLWTDLMMNNWIEKEYNFIIIDEGFKDEGFKLDEFKPLVERYFVKASTLKIPNHTFGLYKRRGNLESPDQVVPNGAKSSNGNSERSDEAFNCDRMCD